MSKYANRRFVILHNEWNQNEFRKLPDNVQHELQQLTIHFGGRFCTRDEFVSVTAHLIRQRKGYQTRGGSDYAEREASHRFVEALKPKYNILYEIK